MKVLIVDDEKHVRDAIRLLVDWAKHGIDGILEAPEGETAVRILEAEKPEIVFTDMRMPIMDGVGLLEWIHEHHPSCKTIVVSGHDDFDFVRHTVKYGGLDYILKPIDPDELDGALAKAVDAWKRENEARLRDQIRAIQINEIKPVYWDRLFSGLIADEAAAPALPAQFGQEFGLPVLPGEARVAVMTIDTMPRAVRGKFGSDLDLLFSRWPTSPTNICTKTGPAMRSGTGTAGANSSSSAGGTWMDFRSGSGASTRASGPRWAAAWMRASAPPRVFRRGSGNRTARRRASCGSGTCSGKPAKC